MKLLDLGVMIILSQGALITMVADESTLCWLKANRIEQCTCST